MQVTVRFLGPQKLETKLNEYDIQCVENICVIDVIGFLRILFPNISLGEIILVNDVKANTQTRLKHKDELMFIPTIGGG